MSRLPPLNTVSYDPIISVETSAFTPTPVELSPDSPFFITQGAVPASSLVGSTGEAEVEGPTLKPFYRARPLWLVPFAIISALVRGMTLAPRVEVYTQLACYSLHGHHDYNHTSTPSSYPVSESQSYTLDPIAPYIFPEWKSPPTPFITEILSATTDSKADRGDVGGQLGEETGDFKRIPSARCIADPAVQSGAAKLQTLMTVTMGMLSALTTGWWGHYGQRHGRTKVLALSTLGLLLTDLMFIVVSMPSSPFSGYGHRLLVIAPIIEGLLGGWSTVQSASSAYISDCTASGSRAHIFSQFTGVYYIGLSIGPGIGGWLIHNTKWGSTAAGTKAVTAVFCIAVLCSLTNFALALFILPESLDKVRREKASEGQRLSAKAKGKMVASGERNVQLGEGSSRTLREDVDERQGLLHELFSPLKIFLPVTIRMGIRQRQDWNLTLLAAALFTMMLSSGVYQLKYLYAVHVYEWSAEQLSYYVSAMGIARALFCLVLLPYIINTFKPRPKPKNRSQLVSHPIGQKPPPTPAHLAREISFDVSLARGSLFIDILSNVLISVTPLPTYKTHGLLGTAAIQMDDTAKKSQALFVVASAMTGMGSGTLPAIQSLSLCILQLRSFGIPFSSEESGRAAEEDTGRLFGALAVLQAVGQMIIGPLLFGLLYSGTVASYPKAIFTTAAGILFVSLLLVSLVETPKVRTLNNGKKVFKDVERGRSRVSKDLRRGKSYGSIGKPSTSTAPP